MNKAKYTALLLILVGLFTSACSTTSQSYSGKEIRIRHVMVKLPANATLEDMNKAYRKLNSAYQAVRLKAMNIATVASRMSDHSSRAYGGDMGWLKPGDVGDPVFERELWKLTKKEPLSDIFRTAHGLHFIELVDFR